MANLKQNRCIGLCLLIEWRDRVIADNPIPSPPDDVLVNMAATIAFAFQAGPAMKKVGWATIRAGVARQAYNEWLVLDPEDGTILNVEYTFSPQ